MDIEPAPRLEHFVGGQNGGTGPTNSATNKELGTSEMIVVPRSEYHALQAELAQLKSRPNFIWRLEERIAEISNIATVPFKNKRFRKALVSGAMYVGTWIIAPLAVLQLEDIWLEISPPRTK